MESLGTTQAKHAWPVVRLGDICDLYQPQTLARKDLNSNGPFPVYGANGVIGHHSAYNHENPELVMGCRGVCGVLHITEAKSWINGNAMVVHPKTRDLEISFLRLVLTAMQMEIAAITSGTAQPQITRTGLAPLAIPFPPPSVQREIVACLESELAEADRLASNFKRIAELADAEFKAELDEAFHQITGKRVRLGDVCDLYQPQTLSLKELDPNGPYPVYGANGVIGKHSTYNHENPELVMACRGASCGALNVTSAKSWINGNAMVVHPKKPDLEMPFLRYLLAAMTNEVTAIISGAAQPQITRIGLSPLIIPIPPLEEQRALVYRLNQSWDTAKQLRKKALRGMDWAGRFRTAILTEAFAQ